MEGAAGKILEDLAGLGRGQDRLEEELKKELAGIRAEVGSLGELLSKRCQQLAMSRVSSASEEKEDMPRAAIAAAAGPPSYGCLEPFPGEQSPPYYCSGPLVGRLASVPASLGGRPYSPRSGSGARRGSFMDSPRPTMPARRGSLMHTTGSLNADMAFARLNSGTSQRSGFFDVRISSGVRRPEAGFLPPSLPPTWPACVESRPLLLRDTRMACSDSSAMEKVMTDRDLIPRMKPVMSSYVSLMASEMDRVSNQETRSRWTLDPSSNFCLVYGAITLLILAHDAFMIPWTLAWEVPFTGPTLHLAWVSCTFWTWDMFQGFFMGYYQRQSLELRLRKTVLHHARTWFVPDLCVVVTDWFSIISSVASDSGVAGTASRMVRFAKVGKLMRLLGLLRMTKVVKIFEDYVECSLSELSRLGLRLLQFFLVIMWLCHIISCCWFMLGHVHSDTGMSWLNVSMMQETPHGFVELPFLQGSYLYQYVTSLQWSMAQVSLGGTDINCYNTYERAFNCLCILMGLIGGSTLVSSLSATMVEYQVVRKDQTQKLAKLRRYLRENRRAITKATALLVQQQAVERLRLTDRLQEKDVTVLELVSSALRRELRFEIFRPMLACHGLFHVWLTLDLKTVQRVCLEALEYAHLRPHDDLFLAGTRTDQAYHLSSGSLHYTKEPETAPVRDPELTAVSEGSWMSEASLWSCWVHVGTARASSSCEVLIVPAHVVNMMVQHHPEVRSITGHYAKEVHKRIVTSSPPKAPYPDDLEVPLSHFEDTVMCMSASLQQSLSLQVIGRNGAKATALSSKLELEVTQRKACVIMNPDGSLCRLQAMVVLRLQNSQRQVLVELGRTAGLALRFAATCQLPTRTQEQGETSADTLAKIVSRLRLDSSRVQMQGMERRVEVKNSGDSLVQTKCIHYMHSGTVREGGLGLRRLSPPQRLPSKMAFKEAKSDTDERSFLEDLMAEPVYLDRGRDAQCIYAWLSPSAFISLSSPGSEKLLHTWLAHVNSHMLVSPEKMRARSTDSRIGSDSEALSHSRTPEPDSEEWQAIASEARVDIETPPEMPEEVHLSQEQEDLHEISPNVVIAQEAL